MGVHGMRNLFENNDVPEEERNLALEEQIQQIDVVRISHNGVIIGTGERSIFGDIGRMTLNPDGVKLFQSRIAYQIADD